MEQVGREAMAESYDLLLGGHTYDLFAKSHVATPDINPVDDQLTRARKFVVTSRTEPLQWQNSEKVTGNIVEEIKRLKAQDGPLLQVHGSWQLIQMLLIENLIDEFRLWTFPVIVGKGKRLFSDGVVPTTLQSVKIKSTPSGAFMNFWRPMATDAA